MPFVVFFFLSCVPTQAEQTTEVHIHFQEYTLDKFAVNFEKKVSLYKHFMYVKLEKQSVAIFCN